MTKILTGPTTAQGTIAVATAKRVGYGRVSTTHQGEEQQRAQLEAAGCTVVFSETISGAKARADRPALAEALALLQEGDTLVVCKLDRLARSLQELLAISADLAARGINLQILDQSIDTSTNTGRLLFSMLGAIAEFERALAVERTQASVAHRRATGGDLGGRRPSYTPQQAAMAQRLRAEGQSLREIALAVGVSKGTAHRMVGSTQEVV